MIGADELVVNIDHGIRRKRKTDSGISISFAQNCCVDPDYFAIHIHQRATGISGVDGSVSLNKGLELAGRNDIAAFRGNDAGGYSANLSEGAANRENPIAHLHAVGVAHLCRGNSSIQVNLDHGQIRFLVFADHLGVVLHTWRIILQTHADPVGFFDHMAIGNDVALGIDDYARSKRTLANRSIAIGSALPALSTEEAVEKIVHTAVAPTAAAFFVIIGSLAAAPVWILNSRFCIDVDHARP